MTISEQKVKLQVNSSFIVRQHLDCHRLQTIKKVTFFLFFTTSKSCLVFPMLAKMSSESQEIVRPLEEAANKKGPAAFVSDITGYFLFEKHRFRSYVFFFYSFSHHSNFQFQQAT